VVCAPLRICTIELQPGERLTGEPHIGDSVRWDVSPGLVGADPNAVSMIVIKPRSPGLDTNLLLTTDRRAYYLRLVSRSEDYVARVAFEYPDNQDRWREQLAREAEARRKQEFEAVRIAPVDSIENLYFDYRIQGGDENMRPVRVVDDGRKTYIQMTPNAIAREAPILVVLGPDGAEMVNYRVKGDMYIVDRLFERGALILGVGKHARRAEIFRGTYNAKNLGKVGKQRDPYAAIAGEKKDERQ
jgi:type IV secretion system protein VirB9